MKSFKYLIETKIALHIFLVAVIFAFVVNQSMASNTEPQIDNISDADCYVPPPSTIWDIELKTVSNMPVHYMATPFVGDLDGDGRVEVVVPGIGEPFASSQILVFDDSLRLIRAIDLETASPQHFTTNLLIADVDNDGFGDIVVGTTDNTLLCYSHLGEKKWRSTEAFNADIISDVNYCPSLIISDINSDGYAEILAVDKIYDAATGNLLVTLPAGGRGLSEGGPESYMPVFADIDNDGVQEVIAGNTVYKITINSIENAWQNHAMVFRQMPANFPDGFTSVADIDMDGDLDIIVTAGISKTQAIMYVWDGATATQIGQTITLETEGGRISRAFVGDILGDGRPDIAFTYTQRIVAYKYDQAENTFENIFSQPTTDVSGATTMSMFDFNQDGEVELVYRDMEDLRIINKSGETIASFPCFSGTHTEYPVIVDLDRNGHADILVSGSLYDADGDVLANTTYIMHYGSITRNQWAPARSVWNQHAYNSVNINENLTVPRYQLNPATAFPGDDMGYVYPFNNFLQQQTALNKDGLPLWVTPDAKAEETLSDYYISGTSLIVNFGFTNIGDAAIGLPVHVTLYADTISQESKIVTRIAKIQVPPAKTSFVMIMVTDVSAYLASADSILVRVNDDGTTFPYHLECDTTNNVWSFFVGTHTISGTISGLPNNEGVKVYYELDAGERDSVTTTFGGTYIISDIPHDSNLEIIPYDSIGYTHSGNVMSTNIRADITEQDIIYKKSVYRWWYLSTPYSNATANTFNIPAGTLGTSVGSLIGYYKEANKKYENPITEPNMAFRAGIGFVASLDTTIEAFNTPTLSIFNGENPNSILSVIVTNTDDDGIPGQSGKEGKNLLGNPYTDPIDFNSLYNYASNSSVIQGSYWIRGWNRAANKMMYDTYNSGGLGTGNINGIALTEVIPVIQGFWVQAMSDGAVTFVSNMTTAATSPALRSPAVNTNKVARLKVKGEKASDETLLVFRSGASNNYDVCDSEKMSNDDKEIPELYTKIGNREIVINGLPPITDYNEVSMPLGFRTGKAGSFSISGVFENWDNTKAFLRDNNNKIETELTEGEIYNFTSGVYNSTNRFTIVIKGGPAGVNAAESNTNIFVNEANSIVVSTDIPNAECSVYNTLGQKLGTEIITLSPKTLEYILESGVYLVKVGNKTERVIIK